MAKSELLGRYSHLIPEIFHRSESVYASVVLSLIAVLEAYEDRGYPQHVLLETLIEVSGCEDLASFLELLDLNLNHTRPELYQAVLTKILDDIPNIPIPLEKIEQLLRELVTPELEHVRAAVTFYTPGADVATAMAEYLDSDDEIVDALVVFMQELFASCDLEPRDILPEELRAFYTQFSFSFVSSVVEDEEPQSRDTAQLNPPPKLLTCQNRSRKRKKIPSTCQQLGTEAKKPQQVRRRFYIDPLNEAAEAMLSPVVKPGVENSPIVRYQPQPRPELVVWSREANKRLQQLLLFSPQVRPFFRQVFLNEVVYMQSMWYEQLLRLAEGAVQKIEAEVEEVIDFCNSEVQAHFFTLLQHTVAEHGPVRIHKQMHTLRDTQGHLAKLIADRAAFGARSTEDIEPSLTIEVLAFDDDLWIVTEAITTADNASRRHICKLCLESDGESDSIVIQFSDDDVVTNETATYIADFFSCINLDHKPEVPSQLYEAFPWYEAQLDAVRKTRTLAEFFAWLNEKNTKTPYSLSDYSEMNGDDRQHDASDDSTLFRTPEGENNFGEIKTAVLPSSGEQDETSKSGVADDADSSEDDGGPSTLFSFYYAVSQGTLQPEDVTLTKPHVVSPTAVLYDTRQDPFNNTQL